MLAEIRNFYLQLIKTSFCLSYQNKHGNAPRENVQAALAHFLVFFLSRLKLNKIHTKSCLVSASSIRYLPVLFSGQTPLLSLAFYEIYCKNFLRWRLKKPMADYLLLSHSIFIFVLFFFFVTAEMPLSKLLPQFQSSARLKHCRFWFKGGPRRHSF